MAESGTELVFESPITKSYPAAGGDGLRLTDLSATTKVIVRAESTGAAQRQLAVAFGASRQSGDVLICGQRPTEWLILGDGGAVADFVAGLDRSGHVSVVDHTHSRALFRLSGDTATSLLEKICSLDWGETMTPNGAVLSASIAKTGCDIIRNDTEGARSYLIACDRSFAQFLFDAIVDAGQEFEIAVAG
ncbi:MAG: sarcosine oxidase subunit gamma [Acidimicrobiales bacterium]